MEEKETTEIEGKEPAADVPAEEKEPLTGRARWEAAVRAKYGNDMTEDELYDRVGQDYDSERAYADNARGLREQLRNVTLADPEIKKFIDTVNAGGSVSEAAKGIPDDMPPADAEAYANMETEAEKRADAVLESYSRLSANLENSKKTLAEYFKKNDVSKEEADELTSQFMDKIAQPIAEGMITEEALELIAKGLCYDKHRVKWEEAGRIAGRNDKIEEERKKFERSPDGLPRPNNSNGVHKEVPSDKNREWIQGILDASRPRTAFSR